MADRSRQTNPAGAPPRARATAPSSGVRRNLFQGQLTRRPTPGSSSNPTESLELDVEVLPGSSEIVVRDQHGEVELGDPPTPEMEEQDQMALDDRQETESAFFA